MYHALVKRLAAKNFDLINTKGHAELLASCTRDIWPGRSHPDGDDSSAPDQPEADQHDDYEPPPRPPRPPRKLNCKSMPDERGLVATRISGWLQPEPSSPSR
jgi:hypothetical protein